MRARTAERLPQAPDRVQGYRSTTGRGRSRARRTGEAARQLPARLAQDRPFRMRECALPAEGEPQRAARVRQALSRARADEGRASRSAREARQEAGGQAASRLESDRARSRWPEAPSVPEGAPASNSKSTA